MGQRQISTTPESTLAALASFPGAARDLIAGGQDRGQDYARWPRAGAARGERDRRAVDRRAAGRGAGAGCADAELTADLATAVPARPQARSGAVVLLCPAAPSFDHYRDFEERGERFSALVHTA